MSKSTLLEAVETNGLQGFLDFATAEHQPIAVKVGGTAMKDVMEQGVESKVDQGIRELQGKFKGRLILVVSAPGKYEGNKLKVTQRLIGTLDAFSSGSQEEGVRILEELKQDHLKMVSDNLKGKCATSVKRIIGEKFAALATFFTIVKTEGIQFPPGHVLDFVAGFGEEVASIILGALLKVEQISTQEFNVRSKEAGKDRDLADIIAELSKRMQTAIESNTTDSMVVVPGFPGFIHGKGTITETGMGYSDLSAVMAVPDQGFLLLLKQSGAILQTNPQLLEQREEVSRIQVMPIRQAVRMTELIGDQIQVIHPMALEEAQRKGLSIMVVDEADPFSGGGTLILPDKIYDQHVSKIRKARSDKLFTLPMMGVAERAHKIVLRFRTPTSKPRELLAINNFQQKLANLGIKVIHQGHVKSEDNGEKQVEMIVAGVSDISQVTATEITDVEGLELSEESFIVGISGSSIRNIDELVDQMREIFREGHLFHQHDSRDILFSVGMLIPVNQTGKRAQKLKEVMKVLNGMAIGEISLSGRE